MDQLLATRFPSYETLGQRYSVDEVGYALDMYDQSSADSKKLSIDGVDAFLERHRVQLSAGHHTVALLTESVQLAKRQDVNETLLNYVTPYAKNWNFAFGTVYVAGSHLFDSGFLTVKHWSVTTTGPIDGKRVIILSTKPQEGGTDFVGNLVDVLREYKTPAMTVEHACEYARKIDFKAVAAEIDKVVYLSFLYIIRQTAGSGPGAQSIPDNAAHSIQSIRQIAQQIRFEVEESSTTVKAGCLDLELPPSESLPHFNATGRMHGPDVLDPLAQHVFFGENYQEADSSKGVDNADSSKGVDNNESESLCTRFCSWLANLIRSICSCFTSSSD